MLEDESSSLLLFLVFSPHVGCPAVGSEDSQGPSLMRSCCFLLLLVVVVVHIILYSNIVSHLIAESDANDVAPNYKVRASRATTPCSLCDPYKCCKKSYNY